MNLEDKNILLKLQQGELDAVIMYKKLAELPELEDIKEQLLEIASDEGRHASILKSYTNEVLNPKEDQANKILGAIKQVGKNQVFSMIAKSEFDGEPIYLKLGEQFEQLKEIAKDEVKHGNMLKSFIK